MTLHTRLRNQVSAQLSIQQGSESEQLNSALRVLSKWRSALLQNTLLKKQGATVAMGPLKGLEFIRQSAEGCHVAKLLGCYEQPLKPYAEQAINARYELILNIGCAEGHYAVDMARRMPATKVLAFDSNAMARDVCRTRAERNHVSEGASIGDLFKPDDFAAYKGRHVLVFCDIEGAEGELLEPAISPALNGMDLIVESHECLKPGVTRLLQERFAETHTVDLVEDAAQRHLTDAPSWFKNLAHLDQLLAVWEWRSGPTPWLIMKTRQVTHV